MKTEYTVTEAAHIMGLPRTTVNDRIRRGKIKARKDHTRRRGAGRRGYIYMVPATELFGDESTKSMQDRIEKLERRVEALENPSYTRILRSEMPMPAAQKRTPPPAEVPSPPAQEGSSGMNRAVPLPTNSFNLKGTWACWYKESKTLHIDGVPTYQSHILVRNPSVGNGIILGLFHLRDEDKWVEGALPIAEISRMTNEEARK